MTSGSTQAFEKRYVNGKVGHVQQTDPLLWKAFYDGVNLGAGSSKSLAMMIVDHHAAEAIYERGLRNGRGSLFNRGSN